MGCPVIYLMLNSAREQNASLRLRRAIFEDVDRADRTSLTRYRQAMAMDSNAFRIGNIVRNQENYSRPEFLSDEKEWFGFIQDVVLQDDAVQLEYLINILKPPIEYLQFESYLAAIGGHLATLRCLLNSGTEVDHMIAWNGCLDGNRSIEMFELLFEHGWNVNADLRHGTTPLSLVLGDESLVRWLLAHGANPKIGKFVIFDGRAKLCEDSPQILNAASSVSTVRVLDLLLSYGARSETLTLHLSVQSIPTSERIEMVKRLLNLGVDVNELDNKLLGPYAKGTPLVHAAEYSNLEATRLLLAHGADPAIKSETSSSALKWAQSRFMEEAEFMINSPWEHRLTEVPLLARMWLIWRAMYQATLK